MKQIFITAICCSLCISIYAQQLYPVAPAAAGNITAIEYFTDDNLNFGSGTALTGFTAAATVNNFSGTINVTGITPGFHRFYIRTKDVNGKWSLTNNSFFDNYIVPVYNTATAPAANITAMEYFIDNNSDFGSGTALTGFPAAVNINNFNGTVNLTGLTTGFHRFYIRSKDGNNRWSITNATAFDNYSAPVYNSAPPVATNMVLLEYFLDNNDAGFGSCTPIPFTAGTNVANLNANINITGLLAGVHRLFIRGKDANGKWSITNFSIFDNTAAMPYPVAAAAAGNISNMEYYIDTDPGFGNATAITVPGNSGSISNYGININLSGSLAAGTHYLYIRSKQNPWSLTTVVPFSAAVALPLTWSFVKAQIINNQTLVSWATEQEVNTYRFEIEHSINGINFMKAGEVAAAGNSSITINYSFTHLTPVTGFNFYRIKQIDLNGNFKYSAIVKVLNNSNIRQTIIAPNPVTDLLNIVEPASTFIHSIEVYDSRGALVIRKNISANVQLYSLPVAMLSKGNYALKIVYKNESKSLLFIK